MSLYFLPLAPALGVLINGLAGKHFSRQMIAIVAVTAVGVPLLIAGWLCYQMILAPATTKAMTATLYQWISTTAVSINIGLLLDPLSMVMVLVVLFIGFFIHIYSVVYMKEDPGFRRFFVYMNLFIFFMIILVMADNLALMFVGWEGVGLCSYLLIGFRHEKKSAADAGRKAFVVNRIGDFGFILGILLVIVTFHTVQFSELSKILASHHGISNLTLTIAALLLFTGAMGKSAQFPLHVWLPDAMEGPTPVSALIHAATMVNAGVYFMCRMAPLLQQAPYVLTFIAVIGLITAVYAALSALGQDDIKKVLAYSTISQIGFMFIAVGSGIFTAGMFHLVTHGIFKGLLFLGAGAVMHALHGELNIYNMGDLSGHLKIVAATFFIGLLALAGIFPLSGFFSKDAILWGAFEQYGSWYWLLAVVGALITALYCGKLFGVAFLGKQNFSGTIHKPDAVITMPLAVLAFCAVGTGVFGLPMFTPNTLFSRIMGSSFAPTEAGHAVAVAAGSHTLEIVLTVAVSIIVITVFIIALRIFSIHRDKAALFSASYRKTGEFLHAGFGMDGLYDLLWVRPYEWIAQICHTVIDRIIIDGTVNGTGKMANATGGLFSALHSGQLRYYAVSILAGVFTFVSVTYFLIP